MLLAAAVVAPLLIAEIALHGFIPAADRPEAFAHQLSENPKLFYDPVPRASREVTYFEGTVDETAVRYEINAAGFRDRDYSVKPPSGVERIVFLGDSIVFGFSVDGHDAMPKQLEQRFRDHDDATQVLNMGVSGYDTEQEVEFFKVKGAAYEPDLVVVGYALNDARYASWELDVLRNNWEAFVRQPATNIRTKTLAFLFKNSRILDLLNRQFHIQKRASFLQAYPLLFDFVEEKYLSQRDPEGSPYRRLEALIQQEATRLGTPEPALNYMMQGIGFRNENPVFSSHWQLSEAAFRDLAQLSKERGFGVAVVLWPLMSSMATYPLGPLHQFLRVKLEAMGFEVIDPKDYLQELWMSHGDKLSLDGIHFTPWANEKISNFLYPRIRDILRAQASDNDG